MKADIKKMLNRSVRMSAVLEQAFGIFVDRGPFCCPFPDHGSDDAHPSAQFFEESNTVYCHAEKRVYTVYDALIAAGKTDAQITQFVVNELGGAVLADLCRDEKRAEVCESKVGIHMEGTAAQYKRGNVTWKSTVPVIEAYFERLEEDR